MNVSAAAVGELRQGPRRASPATLAAIAAAGSSTIVAVIAGGSAATAIVPVLLLTVGYAVWRFPLRWSAAVLLFVSLSVDTTNDGDLGRFTTPFAIIGDMLRYNLERTFMPGVKLSGMELILLLLLLVSVARRLRGVHVDLEGRVGSASVARDLAVVCLLAVAYAVLNGVARGGEVLIWQMRVLLQPILLYFLFHAAFRGPADHVTIGRIVVIAATLKAILSLWVSHTVVRTDGLPLEFTTNHGDSILFNAGVLVLVAHLAERTDRRRLLTAAVLVPLILWGMKENDRRIAWVGLLMSLATIYLLASWRPWKRFVTRATLVVAPVVLLYVGVGWNSRNAVFAPVQLLRSVGDGRQDASTYWRQVENYNIAMSMREAPVLGFGLGRAYVQHIPNYDITHLYPEWRHWPHNSALGLLLFGGIVAFTAWWAIFAVAVFLAVRSYRRARVPEDRAAALCVVTAVLLCIIQAFGDIGAPLLQYRIFGGLALAVAAKLAVATGAWPAKAPQASARAPEPSPAP